MSISEIKKQMNAVILEILSASCLVLTSIWSCGHPRVPPSTFHRILSLSQREDAETPTAYNASSGGNSVRTSHLVHPHLSLSQYSIEKYLAKYFQNSILYQFLILQKYIPFIKVFCPVSGKFQKQPRIRYNNSIKILKINLKIKNNTFWIDLIILSKYFKSQGRYSK